MISDSDVALLYMARVDFSTHSSALRPLHRQPLLLATSEGLQRLLLPSRSALLRPDRTCSSVRCPSAILRPCRPFRSPPGLPSCLDQHGPSAPPLSTLRPIDSPSELLLLPDFLFTSSASSPLPLAALTGPQSLKLVLALEDRYFVFVTDRSSEHQRCGVGISAACPCLETRGSSVSDLHSVTVTVLARDARKLASHAAPPVGPPDPRRPRY